MSPFPTLSASGGAPAAFPDPTPVWQQRFRGLRWTDMPGGDTVLQKIHFALWRRGLVKMITDDAAPTGRRLGGRLLPGWGKGASDGEAASSTPGPDVDQEMDVSVDADTVATADADGDGNAASGKDTRTSGVGPHEVQGNVKGTASARARKNARAAAARRGRVSLRRGSMKPLLEESEWAPGQKRRRDLAAVLALKDRIQEAAAAAGLTLQEAAERSGMDRCSLKPSQLVKSGPKHHARMEALLEQLEQLVRGNKPRKEGA